jgi:hypothetical protein
MALILVLLLLLSGCTRPGVDPTTSTTQGHILVPGATTALPTAPEATVPPQTETTPAQTIPPTTAPVETAPTETLPPQTVPPETTTPPTEPVPPQPTDPKPTAPKPTEPVPVDPARPVSSATCKDTGSNEIWPDPASYNLDYYEEKDPERKDFLQYLQAEGNEFYFWLQEPAMRMYIGRTYGMPLFTSYEIATACVWTSSDPSIATVNSVGFITPLKEGRVIISVTYGEETRTCPVDILAEPQYTYAYLEQRAKEEAQLIADNVMNDPQLKTDLERIAKAARLINNYVGAGRETSSVPGYNQPFGTLVTFYSSCAGSTRAMGLVLEYMGFEWYHVNENSWSHQWCLVYDVDGQAAFADGSMYGVVGYGQRLEDMSNWMWYKNTQELVVPFR